MKIVGEINAHQPPIMGLINLVTISLLVLVVPIFATDHDQAIQQSSVSDNNPTVQVEATPLQEEQKQPTIEQRHSSDIVISSLEDEILTASGKRTSDRHHYEQQTTEHEQHSADKQVSTQNTADASANVSEQLASSNSKPEPRNQEDQQQHQQQDPVIIDHRPGGSGFHHEQQANSGLVQEFAQTTQPPMPSTSTVATTISSLPAYISSPATSLSVGATVQQPTLAPVATTSWYSPPLQTQQNFAQLQHQYNQVQTGGQQSVANYGQSTLLSQPSNQVITVQHPTSINSIISEQQQSSMQPMGAATTNQQQQSGAQLVSVNGQPANLILVNPGTLNGGRRISISGWLKGISSMLANIFNRREHGTNNLAPSNSAGHWIQLGPNAPHWLSQAQTIFQQQQQQQQQILGASTNRYATFIQAPQVTGPATIQHQPPATMTIALQQPGATLVSNGQQQQNNYQMGDLQASASSASYVTIQPPNHQTIQQQQQQQNHLQHQQQYQSAPVHHLSQSTTTMTRQNSVAEPQARQIGSSSQPAAAQPNGSQQQQQSSTGGSSQSSWSSPAPLSAPSSPPSNGQQIASAQQSPTIKSPTRIGRSSTFASNQNLPLAHYSGYTTSTD